MNPPLSFGKFDSKKHFMVAYDDVAMGRKIEFEFIKEGLDRNELSIYLVHGDVKPVEKEMLSFGIDLSHYKKKGLLKILSIGNPMEDSADFLDSVQALMQRILPNPETPFRIVGRLLPYVETETAMAIQVKFEKIFHNSMFDKLNGSILCTYQLSEIKATNQWMKWLEELQESHHAYLIYENGKSNLTVNA
ncbi:MAG: MEDS domain-containing protein [Nitrosotalea sp.]